MTKEEKQKQTLNLKDLELSPGWLVLKNHIERQIKFVGNLKNIDINPNKVDNDNIALQVIVRRSKIDIYSGILNWVEVQSKGG